MTSKVRSILISCVLLFLTCFRTYGQFEPLLHQPYRDKVVGIDTLYRNLFALQDTGKILAAAAAMKNFAQKNDDRELELEAEIFIAYFYMREPAPNTSYQVHQQNQSRMLAIAEKGRNENYLHIEARALRVIAEYYWRWMGNYELSFEYYLKLDRLLAQTSVRDFPNMVEYYCLIAERYYFFQDYGTAIKFLKKAIIAAPVNAFNWKAIWSAKNTLGLTYQKLNQLDSSDFYFHQAIQSPFIKPGAIHYTIVEGNLGENQYLKGNYRQAIPLLCADLKNAVATKDWGLASGSATVLAAVYTRLKLWDSAWNLLQQSRQYIDSAPAVQHTRRLAKWYPVISNWYLDQTNLLMANRYQDSTIIMNERLSKEFNALQLARAQQKIDKEREIAAAETLKESEARRNRQIIVLSAMLVLLIASAGILYIKQRKKHRSRQQAHQAALNATVHELHTAREHLSSSALEIAAKNKQIEELQTSEVALHQNELTTLQQFTILTEEDWINFRKAFEKLYPGYLGRLKQAAPMLTPAEIRFLALCRLGLSHKEMAAALGISSQSMRVTWHRIRKKINIDTALSASEYAAGI